MLNIGAEHVTSVPPGSSPTDGPAPMKQYNVGYPLERVAIDIMAPLPCSNNARYLLLVSCYFTKWLDAALMLKLLLQN